MVAAALPALSPVTAAIDRDVQPDALLVLPVTRPVRRSSNRDGRMVYHRLNPQRLMHLGIDVLTAVIR